MNPQVKVPEPGVPSGLRELRAEEAGDEATGMSTGGGRV